MLLDPDSPEDVDQVRAAMLAKSEAKSSKLGHVVALLTISLMLFWAQQRTTSGHTGEFILALVLVLAVHEGGHALAMRVFGYSDLKVFFIPFLGAAASGRKHDASAVQRAIVSLMGPLPGLLVSVIALAFAPFESALLARLVTLSLFINAFNLLPLMPLDGGRYLDATLFARWPIMRQIVGHLSGLALAGLGWYLEAWVLLGFGVFTFMIAGSARIIGDGALALGNMVEPGERSGPFPDRLIPAGIEFANREVFSKTKPSPSGYANILMKVWAQLGQEPPSVAATLGLLAAYGAAIGLAALGFMQLGLFD